MLPTVYVKFENPRYNYHTDVSATLSEAEARKYFVGTMFNMGGMSYDWDTDTETEVDDMQRCIDISFSTVTVA